MNTRRQTGHQGRKTAINGLVAFLAGISLGMTDVASLAAEPAANLNSSDRLAREIMERVEPPTTAVTKQSAERRSKAATVQELKSLVTTDQWTEVWPDGKGGMQNREVTGEIWNAAIQAALDKTGGVILPKQGKPYYLAGPIVLKSGQFLIADPRAEIRLRPGANTCMVRNEHLVSGQNGPVAVDTRRDAGILIDGGIWSTLATSHTRSNGNSRGRADMRDSVFGCHGVILLSNVRAAVVRNVTIRQSRAFGLHLSNCDAFLVDRITFEDQGRDGVHVNGPASYGVIRHVRGVTYDDFIALNAWDWRNYAPTFGPIHHVLVEDATGGDGVSADSASPLPDGTAEVRLLPGTKNFPGGAQVHCDISDCVFRSLANVRTVKMYDQPNLELGRDNDFADPIGTARRLYFSRLVFNHPGRFQIAANVDGLTIDDVQLCFAQADTFTLVEIGPMSATYQHGNDDPSRWVELFSPDRDVTVRNFHLSNVRVKSGGTLKSVSAPEKRLVKATDQKLNPEYPKTTPRGGTGKGIWIR